MKLTFADAEEGGSITYRVAGETFGSQPRITEGHAQGQIVGAQCASHIGRGICLINSGSSAMAVRSFGLQGLDQNGPTPLSFESGRPRRIARQHFDNIAIDLNSCAA